jgi:hypothetical protein
MSITPAHIFTEPTKKMKRLLEYRKYILFCATPNQFREKEFGCTTNEAFGKSNGVSLRSLMVWRVRDDFWPQVNKAMDVYLKQYTPSVRGAMLNKIMKTGDAAEVKLWHQLVEGWSEKTDNQFSVNRESIKALQDANRAIFEAAKADDAKRKANQKNPGAS